MTRTKEIAELSEGELDAAAGGLKYKLDRAFIKSWSTSGDADDRSAEDAIIGYTEIELA